MPTAVEVFEGVLSGAVGLVSGVVAAPLSETQTNNKIAQTIAMIAGLCSDLGPIAAAVSVGAHVAAVYEASQVLNEDDERVQLDSDFGQTSNYVKDNLAYLGDLIEIYGNVVGVLDAITADNLIAVEIHSVCKYLSVALDASGLALSSGAIAGEIGTQFGQDLLNSVKAELTTLKSGVLSSTQIGTQLAGAAWSPFVASLITALGDTVTSISDIGSANFLTDTKAISKDYTKIKTALIALFSSSGASVQTVTETATDSGASLTNTDKSVVLSIGTDPAAENRSNTLISETSYTVSDTSSDGETSFTGDNTLTSNGIDSTTLLGLSGSGSASLTASYDPTGSTSQQLEFDGVAITIPASALASFSEGANGITLLVSSPTTGDEVTIKSGSDGSIAIVEGDSQQIVDYAPDGLSGDTIDISNDSDPIAITTDIGSGGIATVQSNSDASGVVQNFRFADEPEEANDGEGDILQIDDSSKFTGTILNFLPGDTIDLADFTAASDNAATLGSNNVLTVRGSDGGKATLQLDPNQSFDGLTFETDGTDVIVVPAPEESGSQSVTVDEPVTDPDTGKTTTYTAGVTLTGTNIQFAAVRLDDAPPRAIAFTATFEGGTLDPQFADAPDQVFVSSDPPVSAKNPSHFYVSGEITNLGPDNSSVMGEIAPLLSSLPGAGDYSGETLPVVVSYGSASTTVNLNVGIKIYAPAVPELEVDGAPAFAINFGTIHIGQSASMNIDVANVATGDLTDSLSTSKGTIGEFTAENGLADVEAGSDGMVTVSVTGETAGQAIIFDGDRLFGFTTHDSDLPDQAVSSEAPPVIEAVVNYYADPAFSNSDASLGTAVLTQDGDNWTLDFGTLDQNTAGWNGGNIEIDNAAPEENSDTLSGSAAITSTDGGFIQSIQNVAGEGEADGGSFLELGDIGPDTSALGAHTESFVFHPVSSNNSGSTTLPDITLTVIDDVVSNGALAISSVVADQTVSDGDVIAPFADVSITDPTSGQAQESLTVMLSSAGNGTLSSFNGGSYNPTSGAYTISGSAATVTAALDTLVFTPASTSSDQPITTHLTINVSDDAGQSATASAAVTAGPATAPPPTDNILWQNTSGQASIWEMDGNALVGGGPVSPSPGSSFRAVGTGDFNKDGQSDILWQNTNTGQASIWDMSNNTLIGGGPVTPNPGPSWHAVGTGDFNHDGFSDILWQNPSTGQASIWEMHANTLVGGGPVTPNPGTAWKAIGTGDFNKDGDSDILWQNTSTGQVSIWEMEDNKLIGGGPVTPNPGTAWQAIGTGDFNQDGFTDDILFQNRTTGQVSVWEMNGTSLAGGGPVSANPGTSWHAIGADGGSDVLFQNTSGQATIWDMSGNTITGGGPVSPNPGPTWHAIGLSQVS